MVAYLKATWPEWVCASVMMLGTGIVGGYIGGQLPLSWFKVGICG